MIRARSASRQGVRRRRPIASGRRSPRVRPSLCLPALQRARVDAGQSTGRGQPGTVGAGLVRCRRTRVWRSSRRVMRPRLRGRSPRVFLTAQARRPFRPAPCPCDAVPAPSSLIRRRSCFEPPRHWPPAVRRGRRSHPASRPPARPDRQPCSRHQALRAASSIAAVTITASSRAAAVQRRACRRLRSIGQDIRPPTLQRRHADPNCHVRPRSTGELSGGNSRATIRSLNCLSVSSHFLLSAPPKVPILFRRQLV